MQKFDLRRCTIELMQCNSQASSFVDVNYWLRLSLEAFSFSSFLPSFIEMYSGDLRCFFLPNNVLIYFVMTRLSF